MPHSYTPKEDYTGLPHRIKDWKRDVLQVLNGGDPIEKPLNPMPKSLWWSRLLRPSNARAGLSRNQPPLRCP